jgi:TonB-dependent receptor
MFSTSRTRLGAAVLLATTALSGAAFAQTSAEIAASSATVDQIVITGRRPLAESAAAALQVQRESDSLVSVLSADLVGNLPDQNVAYAVGRLPGVAIERDQGQARYVNLRGAPSYWTTLSFDGLSVVSPEGRASRFDNIPSAIASQITVQKAIVPSMPGGAVAGNVDIRTRRAFDYPGQHVTGKIGLGHVELGGGREVDTSLVYSNIFADGKLGVVAQGSYYSRGMATDNWESDPYLSNSTDPNKRFAREHENKHYRLTRYNISGSFRADYKPNDNHDLFVSSVYTLFHDDELRDNFIFRLDQGTNAAGQGYTSAGYISANNPKLGASYGARINARVDYRDTMEWTSINTVGGEHALGGWDVNWRLNYTYANDGRDTPVTAAFQSPSAFNQRPTVIYDLRDNSANTVRLFQTGGTTSARTLGAQVTNIEDFAFPMQSIGMLKGADITQASTAKLDIAREFGATKVEFGGLFTDRKKKSRERSWSRSYSTNAPTWADFADDLGYLGSQDLNYTFRYTDADYTTKFVENLVDQGLATLQDTSGNYWAVSERITAGYLMATTEFDWGNVVYGARVEHIKNTGEAYVPFPASPGQPAQTRLVQTTSDDTLVYPSAHLNWNIRQDLKFRLGLTTSASRPDFDDLRPNFTINDSTQSISGGNPNAKPERQRGVDAYLEWYMNPGFLSVGVYYKDIKDALVTQAGVFGSTELNLPGVDRSGYSYTALANAGDGHLEGIEIFYQGTAESLVRSMEWPSWLEGFGVNASATFTQSTIQLPSVGGVPVRSINVLGTSDAVYNLQAIYEKYGLSVRLAYQYRTPWGQSIGAYQVVNSGVYPVDNGDIFWDSDEELDLSVRYQLSERLELFFDAVNLTNQGSRRYGISDAYPVEYERFGRRYIGGVRFNF